MGWFKIYANLEEAISILGVGKANTIVIEGKKVCIAVINNSVMAISDRCSHNGESLGKGRINYSGEVICPWHGYRFQMKTGRCSSNSPDAEIFPIRMEPGGIFIAI